VTSVTLPVIGAMLGYELTSRSNARSSRPPIALAPVVGTLSNGDHVFGVAGAF